MSDRKLLKKVRDGDKEALSDIIKQYYADIFKTFSLSLLLLFLNLNTMPKKTTVKTILCGHFPFLSLHDTERRRFL